MLREIAALYGSMRARDFGPVELEIIRDGLIERGLTRGYINGQIARAKRVFRWALSKRLVTPDVVTALEALPGLRRGRSGAKEANPVTPVDEVSVNAVLPYLSTAVASMVRLQWLTGARSGELFVMRPMDIDMAGPVWTYDVPRHKCSHHGKARRIPLGPQAQDILIPLLAGRPRTEFVFSPKESAEEHRERRRQARNTPVGHGNATGTNRKARPEREPGEAFSRSAYGLAVRRACDKAGIARWNPHQLRHSYGSRVRRTHGLEAAQVLLGHSRADVTQVYAERDQRLAASVAQRIG